MKGRFFTNSFIWLGLGLVCAASTKAWLILGNWLPFNADEAVVALMARHILQGKFPVFFYGQAYMGSLDAFLVAGGFALFGEHVWVIRLVQGLLYLGVMITTVWLGRRVFDSWRTGILSLILLAIPTVNVTLYTTVSLGGYGEAMLLGNLILLCGLLIVDLVQSEETPGSYCLWLGLGFLSGFGLWAFGLTLVYSIPIFLFILFTSLGTIRSIQSPLVEDNGIEKPVQGYNRMTQLRRFIVAVLVLIAGMLIGSSPWWGCAVTNCQIASGFDKLITELSGSAIAGVEQLPWIFQVGQHFANLVLLGSTVALGLRPPWDVIWLAFPLLPFVLFFWMMVVIHIIKSLLPGHSQAPEYSQAPESSQARASPNRGAQWVLVAVMLTLLVGFILTPFGADPSGRYFLPLAVPLSLFAASLILDLVNRYGKWAYGLTALLLVYNLWGTVQSAMHFPPGITTQFSSETRIDHRFDTALIEFLRQKGESRGYGNYWISYPLAFLSHEDLIFVPRLPYHLDFRFTERDDRYAPYDELVAQSDRVAYITTNHPALDERLRWSFTQEALTWQEIQIGDYHVFYDISAPIRPEEIGLGETTNP
jgi:4-amino-4-deoxy-L-arabinose transferase-like glycosyltransferase